MLASDMSNAGAETAPSPTGAQLLAIQVQVYRQELAGAEARLSEREAELASMAAALQAARKVRGREKIALTLESYLDLANDALVHAKKQNWRSGPIPVVQNANMLTEFIKNAAEAITALRTYYPGGDGTIIESTSSKPAP